MIEIENVFYDFCLKNWYINCILWKLYKDKKCTKYLKKVFKCMCLLNKKLITKT